MATYSHTETFTIPSLVSINKNFYDRNIIFHSVSSNYPFIFYSRADSLPVIFHIEKHFNWEHYDITNFFPTNYFIAYISGSRWELYEDIQDLLPTYSVTTTYPV